jgi:hypothetical protein
MPEDLAIVLGCGRADLQRSDTELSRLAVSPSAEPRRRCQLGAWLSSSCLASLASVALGVAWVLLGTTGCCDAVDSGTRV